MEKNHCYSLSTKKSVFHLILFVFFTSIGTFCYFSNPQLPIACMNEKEKGGNPPKRTGKSQRVQQSFMCFNLCCFVSYCFGDSL